MRPKVTVHKCAVIFRTWILFEGGPYMKKYSNVQDFENNVVACSKLIH